jgi:hypothetical protein
LILIDIDALDATAKASQTSARPILKRAEKEKAPQELPYPPTAPSLPVITFGTSARPFFGSYTFHLYHFPVSEKSLPH